MLRASRDFVLTAVIASSVVGFIWVVITGSLSDRVGRKPHVHHRLRVHAAFGFIYFPLLDTMNPVIIFHHHHHVVATDDDRVRA